MDTGYRIRTLGLKTGRCANYSNAGGIVTGGRFAGRGGVALSAGTRIHGDHHTDCGLMHDSEEDLRSGYRTARERRQWLRHFFYAFQTSRKRAPSVQSCARIRGAKEVAVRGLCLRW